MEITTSEPSGTDTEKVMQKAAICVAIHNKLIGKPDPNLDKCLRDYTVIPKLETDETLEKHLKYIFEEKIPKAGLKSVILEYMPDSVRELRTKREYWKTEFCIWDDVISKKNWKLYDRKLRDEVTKHKTILKNMDKLLEKLKPNLEDKNLFSESLDAERVHNLVTSIKENESDDKPFQDMMRSEEGDDAADLVQTFYFLYAIYARYGEFRVRPSRKNSLQAK